MEDKRNLHLKVQEMVQCYANRNPLEAMSSLAGEADQEEAAVKWLALAVLHAVAAGAKKIELTLDQEGQARVTAKYREAVLPSPGPAVGARALEMARDILHLEGGSGKGLLALGLGNDNLEIKVKLEQEDGGRQLSLKFGE
ncbi:MAG: hypothetical protein HY794_17095 [Desulfarculus sp.]|nr:hypothetical protein [Desulfarculus sp.]